VQERRLAGLEGLTNTLQQALQELQSENRELKDSKVCLEMVTGTLQKSLGELQDDDHRRLLNTANEDRFLGLEKTVGDLHQSLQGLQDQDHQRSKGEEHTVVHEERFLSLEKTITAIEGSLTELQDLDCQVSASSARCGEHEERILQLQQTTNGLQQSLQSLDSERLSRGAFDAQEQRLAGLERASGELRSNLEELPGLDRRLAKLEASQERVAGLEKSVEALQVDVQDLRQAPSGSTHAEQLEDALRRLGKHEDASRALEAQMQQLRSEHEGLAARAGTPTGDLAERLAEVARRIEGSEGKLAEVQNQLEQPMKALEGRLDQLAKDHAQQEQRCLREGDLADRVAEAVQRITSSEKAIGILREEQDEQLQKVRSQLEEPLRAFNDRFEQLRREHAALEQRQLGNGDLAEHMAASSDLAGRVSELEARVSSGEEGVGSLRADVKVAEASLKEALAQVERLVAQAEAVEDARKPGKDEVEPGASGPGAADPVPLAEMEARVHELQRQVSEKLSYLMCQQKDLQTAEKEQVGDLMEHNARVLPGASRSERLERAVAELSGKVSSELQELQEHQHELRNVKDVVGALSKKVSLAEQNMAEDVGASLDTTKMSISKMETIIEDMCKQVNAAVLAGERGAEASQEIQQQLQELRAVRGAPHSEANESLKQQVQKLQSDHNELASCRIHSLEMRMDQLRSEHEDLSHTKMLGDDFVDRVSDVMQRMKGGEEKIAAVEKQLEQPIKALDSRLEQLRGDYEALRQTKVLHSDLTGRICEVLQRLATSEDAIAALQKQPLFEGAVAEAVRGRTMAVQQASERGGEAPVAEVEARIRELQQQVSEEFQCLARHQRELSQADPLHMALTGQDVEKAVVELSRQVAAELRDLRDHQQDLGKIKAAVTALSDRASPSQPPIPNGQGSIMGPEIDGDRRPPRHMEAQVQQLSRQVAAELQALSGQQAELGQAKTTLGELAIQVKDVTDGLAACDASCLGLRQQFDEFRSSSVSGSCTSQGVGLVNSVSASRGCGGMDSTKAGTGVASRGSAGVRKREPKHGMRELPTDADSENSDTYGQEFEESVGEESVSESR